VRLEDLPVVSITQMNDRDALKLILEVRDRRRKRKERKIVERKTSRSSIDKQLDGLSREQLQQILTILRSSS
jgi:hypothetical protein